MGLKIFPKSEYELRIKKAKHLMERDALDAIIITNDKNFQYITAGWRLGFDPIGYMIDETPAAARPGMVILPLDGDPVALVPRLFSRTRERGWIEDVREWYGLPFTIDYLKKELINLGLSKAKIGMEFGEEQRLNLPYDDLLKLKNDLPKAKFLSSSILWDLRKIKSKAEADKIKTACEITGRGFERFFDEVEPNMKVKEVIRLLFNCYMDEGATRPSFPPSLGLDLEEKTLLAGKEYCFDTAAIFDDYTADICRVAIVGRATSHQKEMYDKCVQLNDAVRKNSRAGVKTRKLWDVYLETLDELGVSPIGTIKGLPDRIGHGFGLMGNEPPTIGPNDKYTLEHGNVHCVEPGIGSSSEYFYIEENVWVTKTGNDCLSSNVARDLWEI